MNFEFWNHKFFDKELHFEPPCLANRKRMTASGVWTEAKSAVKYRSEPCEIKMMKDAQRIFITRNTEILRAELSLSLRRCGEVAWLPSPSLKTAWAGCSTYVATNPPANQRTNRAEFFMGTAACSCYFAQEQINTKLWLT